VIADQYEEKAREIVSSILVGFLFGAMSVALLGVLVAAIIALITLGESHNG
jgi:hypothetical protein